MHAVNKMISIFKDLHLLSIIQLQVWLHIQHKPFKCRSQKQNQFDSLKPYDAYMRQ